MKEEYCLYIAILLILLLIYLNSCSGDEYFGSGPEIFLEEGYGEHGTYYDNIKLEPIYRKTPLPTIYDD